MFTVAVIGPDGAGKWAVTQRLQQTLPLPVKYVYMGVNLESSNVVLPTTRIMLELKQRRGGRPDMTGPPDPTRVKTLPKNKLKRLAREVKMSLRLANLMAEEWYRQRIVQKYLADGYIVLSDRHFFCDYYAHDIAVDRSQLPLARRVHGAMLDRYYPRPDLLICLDAPGDVLFARKGEGSPAMLEARRQEYLRLREAVAHYALVDATQSLEAVTEETAAIILNFHAKSEWERGTHTRFFCRTSWRIRRRGRPLKQAAKRLARSLVDSPAVSGLVSLLEGVDQQQPNLLRVVTYHRVDHPESRPSLYPRVTVTPEAFAAQMQFLATHYHPLSLLELLDTPEQQATSAAPTGSPGHF